jgi:hypothetical protein
MSMHLHVSIIDRYEYLCLSHMCCRNSSDTAYMHMHMSWYWISYQYQYQFCSCKIHDYL